MGRIGDWENSRITHRCPNKIFYLWFLQTNKIIKKTDPGQKTLNRHSTSDPEKPGPQLTLGKETGAQLLHRGSKSKKPKNKKTRFGKTKKQPSGKQENSEKSPHHSESEEKPWRQKKPINKGRFLTNQKPLFFKHKSKQTKKQEETQHALRAIFKRKLNDKLHFEN